MNCIFERVAFPEISPLDEGAAEGFTFMLCSSCSLHLVYEVQASRCAAHRVYGAPAELNGAAASVLHWVSLEHVFCTSDKLGV